jgi:integrase
MSNFKQELINSLKNNRKRLSDSSINLYIRNLEKLNDAKEFSNLNFLKKTDNIIAKLEKYKPNTVRTYLISIVSVLSLYKNNKSLSKIYKFYYDKMDKKASDIDSNNKNEKTETQDKNWISWIEVQNKITELKKSIEESFDYKKLLDHLILSLYVFNSPRRNMDYINMYIVKNYNNKLPNDKNYLDLTKKQFIFLKHKTSKIYNETIVDINPQLYEIITEYIKHHPLMKTVKTHKEPIPFLVNQKGIPYKQSNFITKSLNDIFGKRIGSSMLRHIYLSDKFGSTLDDMKKTSQEMGHNLNQQKDYIKTE